ncbi:MAG: hypothetical protein ACLFUJ_16445 [Phycisphaerae bacterium]
MSTDASKTKELVQKAYGEVARKLSSCCGEGSSCCGDNNGYTVPDHPVPDHAYTVANVCDDSSAREAATGLGDKATSLDGVAASLTILAIK